VVHSDDSVPIDGSPTLKLGSERPRRCLYCPVLCQAYFIFRDPEMRDPYTRQWAKARNSNIIEDLGRAAYVFSDKTGTLTSNEMRLRGIAIKGQSFGSLDFRCPPLHVAEGELRFTIFPRHFGVTKHKINGSRQVPPYEYYELTR